MNKTELIFILDRSGSMGGLESDTIGGFNATISDQKKIDGETRVTTILFDNFFEVLHDRINLQDIAPLTDKDYFVRGSTALYDAVALGIRKIANVQKQTKLEGRADKVIMVITTDGYENSSRETNAAMLHKMIDDCKKNGWEFLFLGTDIDAQAAAGSMALKAIGLRTMSKTRRGCGCSMTRSMLPSARCVPALRCRRIGRISSTRTINAPNSGGYEGAKGMGWGS